MYIYLDKSGQNSVLNSRLQSPIGTHEPSSSLINGLLQRQPLMQSFGSKSTQITVTLTKEQFCTGHGLLKQFENTSSFLQIGAAEW